jgi:hypothetical protein
MMLKKSLAMSILLSSYQILDAAYPVKSQEPGNPQSSPNLSFSHIENPRTPLTRSTVTATLHPNPDRAACSGSALDANTAARRTRFPRNTYRRAHAELVSIVEELWPQPAIAGWNWNRPRNLNVR